MSRLHLIGLLFVLYSAKCFSQYKLSEYIDAGNSKFDSGDYIEAINLYQKAMQMDTSSTQLMWKYAEALRAYKDYEQAEVMYTKVYKKEEGVLFPESILWMGLMQKQNGKYELAAETFKKAKVKFGKDKKSKNYIKAKREMESCLWAINAINDTANVISIDIPVQINSTDAEFGHLIWNDQLIFSSLKADSSSNYEEVYSTDYSTQLYRSKLNTDTTIQKLSSSNSTGINNGNGCFSLDGKRFYYSRCSSKGSNYTCVICVAELVNDVLVFMDTLGSIINEPGSNTTMPSIAKIDGKEVLFFSSDRTGGAGSMDIWYSEINDGNQYAKPKNLKTLNSIENELCPWFDTTSSKLYFSSSWQDGFGGQDIFQSTYDTPKKIFTAPINLGIPYNSPANDLYFFIHHDTSYFSSNRRGVNFSKNPTCCSDVFAVHTPMHSIDSTTKSKETLEDLNRRLPVTLYFHNDIPDPRSKDSTTQVNYIKAYSDYHGMIEQYKDEYSKGLSEEKSEIAKEDIEAFFIQYVDQGVKDLELFRDLLLEELQNGARINLNVKGFASPLAKTDYNVNLTKRRINSLINYLRAYENGIFVPYLDATDPNGGKLMVSQIPFGEYNANQLTSDNLNDKKNSVYSRAAAIERKIEIQSVNYLQDDSLLFHVQAEKRVIDLGKVKTYEKINKTISVSILPNLTLIFDSIRSINESFHLSSEKISDTMITVHIESNADFPIGLFTLPILLYFEGYQTPLPITLTGEGY